MRFALVLVKVALVAVLRNYNFQVCEETEVNVCFAHKDQSAITTLTNHNATCVRFPDPANDGPPGLCRPTKTHQTQAGDALKMLRCHDAETLPENKRFALMLVMQQQMSCR